MINNRNTVKLGTRICLAGEGLGLYKGKAITLPIDCFSSSATVMRTQSPGCKIISSDESEDLKKVTLSIQKAFNTKDLKPDGFELSVETNVPTGYGLASSATIYAVITRALSNAFDYGLSADEVASIAYCAENVIDGVLVGKTDTRAVLYREVALQDYKEDPPLFTRLADFPDDSAIVLIGDKPSSYSHTGLRLRERVLAGDPGVEKYSQTVHALLPRLAEAWDNKNRKDVGSLIQALFRSVCDDLQICNPDYPKMVAIALSAGAYAAKNVGLRPSGGSIYALCDKNDVGRVADAFRGHAFVKIVHKENVL